uniref:EF-hand domain-containing protein n=1 Tax=Hucho hucho TaxID=62062 RepID=A0A4W5LP01_9TELE
LIVVAIVRHPVQCPLSLYVSWWWHYLLPVPLSPSSPLCLPLHLSVSLSISLSPSSPRCLPLHSSPSPSSLPTVSLSTSLSPSSPRCLPLHPSPSPSSLPTVSFSTSLSPSPFLSVSLFTPLCLPLHSSVSLFTPLCLPLLSVSLSTPLCLPLHSTLSPSPLLSVSLSTLLCLPLHPSLSPSLPFSVSLSTLLCLPLHPSLSPSPSLPRFMDNLQTEVLEIEFLSYSKGLPIISEEDFAHILLRFTNVDDIAGYLDNVRKSITDEKGITFDEFRSFFQFMNNLEDFAIAMQMYNFANRSIGQG